MSQCNDTQEVLQSMGYKLIKSLYVGAKPGADCRHIYRNDDQKYAYSDITGAFYVDLERYEADKRFNAAVITPKPQLEDIDQTLKELEKNLKIISVRALSYISDYVDRAIERLS